MKNYTLKNSQEYQALTNHDCIVFKFDQLFGINKFFSKQYFPFYDIIMSNIEIIISKKLFIKYIEQHQYFGGNNEN